MNFSAIIIVLLALIAITTAHNAQGCNFGGSCQNADGGCCQECVSLMEKDELAIKAYNENRPESEHIDIGHESLENCYMCTGVCFDNRLGNIHCSIRKRDAGEEEEKTSVHEYLRAHNYSKRAVLAQCDASHIQWLTINRPGFTPHMGQQNTNDVDETTVTNAPTPHPSQVAVTTPPPETFPPPETNAPTPGETVATPPPSPSVAVGTPMPVATTANPNQIAAKPCGKTADGKLLFVDRCNVCGGKSECAAAPPALAVSLLVVLLALVVVPTVF